MNIHEHKPATVMVTFKGGKYHPYNPLAKDILELFNCDAFNRKTLGTFSKKQLAILENKIGFEVEIIK